MVNHVNAYNSNRRDEGRGWIWAETTANFPSTGLNWKRTRKGDDIIVECLDKGWNSYLI